jgi:WD40 repeat protein
MQMDLLRNLFQVFLWLTFISGVFSQTCSTSSDALETFTGHTDPVYSLTVLPDDSFLSGSHDATIKRWKSGTATALETFTGHTNWVASLAILPDGSFLSGSSDTSIKRWKSGTTTALETFRGHTNSTIRK